MLCQWSHATINRNNYTHLTVLCKIRISVTSSYSMKGEVNIYIEQRQRIIALLREMRVQSGLTQAELAARIEKDQTYVSKYESGKRRLDVLEVREICQAIGTTLEEFVRKLGL